MMHANGQNYRIRIERDNVVTERVYLCRCGTEHTGDYAQEDYLHHMCFHDVLLWPMSSTMMICSDCGNTFHVDPEGNRNR